MRLASPRGEPELSREPCSAISPSRGPHRLLLPLAAARPDGEAAVAREGLPFDQYQRYRLVAELCERIARGARLSVLDLGGRTGLLRRFLPGHAVALVDREPSPEPGLVLGDGSALPFRSQSFDLVVACDTLEHVPAERRDAFLSEAMRVARRGVILAGPYDTPRVAEAEESLRVFLRAKLGLAHRYLDEHQEFGLPDLGATARSLEALGARTVSIGHGNLERWLALQCLSMYLDHEPRLRPVAERMHRFYNLALYGSDHAGAVYRHALCALREGEELPELAGLFAPPVSLPVDLEPFASLVAELVAFDRERDVYGAERERVERDLHAVIHDLAEHRRVREELERELARHREVVAELERDGAGLRAVQAELERDLGGHREVLGCARRELAEQAAVIAAAQADLDGHKSLVRELTLDLEGHRGVVAELAPDLEGHRRLVSALRSELDGRQAASRALEGNLEAERARSARLAADLHEARARSLDIERENSGLWQRVGELEALLAPPRLSGARFGSAAPRSASSSRWKSLWEALGGSRQAS